MTAQLAVHGRLGRDPEARSTSTGTAMVTMTIAVTLESYKDGATTDGTLWLEVVAFGRVAQTVKRHAKGDPVSIAGRLQMNQWRNKDGVDQDRLKIVLDSIVSARTAQPGSRRKKPEGDIASTAREADPAQQGPAADDPDDAIPF